MSTADLDRALKTIELHADADFVGPRSEELIARAERALGLTFPPTYRAFLARLGCGDIPGYEFYGIVSDNFENSGIPDAIWLTLEERRSAGLPDMFILVGHNGYTGYYALDLSQPAINGECPVVEWHPDENPDHREHVAEDFGAYLWERVHWVYGN